MLRVRKYKCKRCQAREKVQPAAISENMWTKTNNRWQARENVRMSMENHYGIKIFALTQNKREQYFIELTSLSNTVTSRNFCLGTPPTERLDVDVLSEMILPGTGTFGSSGLKRWRPGRTEMNAKDVNTKHTNENTTKITDKRCCRFSLDLCHTGQFLF